MPVSKPLVFALLACWSKSPLVDPAEALGVAIILIASTLPAKLVVTAKFSVPAKVKSTSVLAVVTPFRVTVPANVALSCTSSISAPLMMMSLPAPVLAIVTVVPPVIPRAAVLVSVGVVTLVPKVGLATVAIVTVSVAPAVVERLVPAAIVMVSPSAIACGVPLVPDSVRLLIEPPPAQLPHVGAPPVLASRH